MLPVLGVSIDFANGATFAYPLILDDPIYGHLNDGVLADGPADLVEITDQVMRVSTRRGRNRILSNFEAGTATVTINDPNSNFDPFNASGPYYGKLIPLRKIRIWADTPYQGSTVRIYLFSGYITSYDTAFYEGTNTTATVTLQCVDGFRLLNNVSTGVPPIPGTFAGQLSGNRIQDILTFAGFPASMRSINPGLSTMQADPGGARSALAAIQTVEQSEFGAFFMSRQGEAKFLDRNSVEQLADITARLYSDTGAAGTQPYASIDFAYDDQLILNNVTVTALNSVNPQTITDQASIDRYFIKSGQRTGILVQSDQEANDQARTLVAARKTAELRIDSMNLNIASEDNEENVVINLTSDIYSLVNIEKTMPGGSTVTRELFIQGVQHDVTPTTWNTKLLTAEPIIQAFILGSSNQGILGNTVPQNSNTLSY
jgi:hypothetical protein